MDQPKHGHMPGPEIPPDIQAQGAANDYQEYSEQRDRDAADAASQAAAEAAGETVGGLRSTGAELAGAGAAVADRATGAKDAAVQAATDLSASARDATTDVGHRLVSTAEVVAERASAAAASASEKAHEVEADSGDGGGWSWEGAKAWSQRQWDEWRQAPGQWAESAQQTAVGWWEHASLQAVGEAVEEWQERHWKAFEERQKARLAALAEKERQHWKAWEERQIKRLEELKEEGSQVVRKEVEAFEECQRRWWETHHPEEARPAHKAPASQQFRLSFLMLPLLPHIGETVRQFGLRTKHGIVGEMRDAGAKMADSLAAAGQKLGVGGDKAA